MPVSRYCTQDGARGCEEYRPQLCFGDNRQAWDTLVVNGIMGDERQFIPESSGSNPCILRRHGEASSTSCRAYLGPILAHLDINGQNRVTQQELFKPPYSRLPPVANGSPLQQ